MDEETTMFFAAVRQDDLQFVKQILEKSPALANKRIGGDATLLNEQIWLNGSIISIDKTETRDTPALHYTAFHGRLEMMELLLTYGADINSLAYENNHEITPAIVLAAWEGGMEVLSCLLKNGANPNVRSSNNITPLSTAIKHNKMDRVELLHAYGAKD